jgi:hypothetical protein
MKRKIQHNAVNNQEDEDSCRDSTCFPIEASVDKNEDKSVGESTGYLFSEASGNKSESTGSQE